ncbi:MAG TPA: electron transfer flavoprotein subunit beta/FixA family protein [Candidatus Polarisedimenticolia bacterium]|jgi:electron transfer flavoprotein beta subunit|nr:electron transfer flavoprotein subunit beta/FixA family protein [Candidatus Polarisedimenticolia bacterium]
MKTLVLVKQVPNTDSPFRVNAAGTWVDEGNLTYGLNDYDRYALEEALRLKDQGKATEVVALSVGPERAATALRTCLATGADRAIHVKDDRLAGADPLSIARVIAAAVKDEGFSLIFGGLQADDDNYTQTPALVARLLGRPCATAVLKAELGEGTIRVERELENQKVQVVEMTLPAVVAVQTGINEPRYASLKGIMAAKKKEIKTVGLAEIGLDPAQVTASAARFKTVRLAIPPKGKGAEILKGSADEVAKELVKRIREKTGVL